jgi:hypothetical protein
MTAIGRIQAGLALLALAADPNGIQAAEVSEGRLIAARFQRLTRSSPWHKVKEVPLPFRTYHPQGMTIVGDHIYLSSVEVINRGEDKGQGHLFEVSLEGKLERRITLGEGAAYHPGGIDFDGQGIWVPVAEYRPDSRTIVYRVDPKTMEVRRAFEFGDHLGGIVCDSVGRRLVAVSWGSRRFYSWELREDGTSPRDPTRPRMLLNGSHYVDFQDGQALSGTSFGLFGGLSRYALGPSEAEGFALGGLELVDLSELRAMHQIPLPLRTARGQPLTQNPWWVRTFGEGLRFYFVPDDDPSTLLVYDVVP